MKTIEIKPMKTRAHYSRVYPANDKPYVVRDRPLIRSNIVPTEPIQRKGIVATLFPRVKSIYPKGPRSFIFDTEIQGAVEQAMINMGFGSSQYCLSYGVWGYAKLESIS